MTAALDRIGQRNAAAQPGNLSQATAVEQARAVAEVQAAVYVAQANPRDLERAYAEMRQACSRLALAQRAFYTVPNRGHDKSVHLARALIRIWGNSDFGVRELHRDDVAGHSEILAYAWDQQLNSRASRSFQNPHARMKGGKREALTDLHDIYLSNQNIGARAVRECIFQILPDDFVEEAAGICRQTLEHGDGKPLADRIREMVAAFEKLGVNVARLETKIGRRRGQWTGQDLADAAVAYTSITRDGISADDLFPQQRVTAADIAAQGRPGTSEQVSSPLETEETISEQQLKKLHATLTEAKLTDRDTRLAYISQEIGREIGSTKELTRREASVVIDALGGQPTTGGDQ